MKDSWNDEITELALPVDKERDHIQGNVNAPLTLLEFGDYECPNCGEAYSIVKRLQEYFDNELRFVFRHFPLRDLHAHAQNAAEVAEIAGKQGIFWEMHDTLFANQFLLDDMSLEMYAEDLGLDIQAFRKEMALHTELDKVQEDFIGGVYSGVNGTPTFFINGVKYEGDLDFDNLLIALKDARHPVYRKV